jgi:hypothetical protein
VTTGGGISHGATAGVLGWLVHAAEKEAPRYSGGAIIYSCSKATRGVLIVCCVAMLGFAFFAYRAPTAPLWVSLLFLGFASMTFLAWPRAITAGSDSLTQRNILGRQKQIPWRNLTALQFRQRDLATFARGSDGGKIVHSPFHVARAQFHAEVARRTGLSNILKTI